MGQPLWILGGGGHAKVVIDTARAMGTTDPIGLLDDDPSRLGTAVLGVTVRGPITRQSLIDLGVRFAVLAIGSNRVRAELADRLAGLAEWATLVHPAACVAPSARLGEGSVVFAGATIQPDVTIGRHVIVNTGATIDHDGSVADYGHLAPGVHLAGNVRVGEGALLGIGSCAIPGRTIGAWATVGAGAVVTSDIPDGVVAVGIPARWTSTDGSCAGERRPAIAGSEP